MAFCNSCGASLNDGTKFCNKCGAATGVAAAPGTPVSAPRPVPSAVPSSGGSSSALKIILIIVAVIVFIGILGMVTCGIVVHRIAKSAHVSQNGDNVKVETPFGSMETNKDPAQVAKDLGVDIYPGAEFQKNGSASVNFGSIHTVTASFTTSDSLDKVCDFYRSRFPSAMTSSSDSDHCNFVSNDGKNMITVNAQSGGDRTKVQISNVTKKANN
jgi:zinc ribbon protein